MEKPSIEALLADEEFHPILEAHLRRERPPPSGDRKPTALSQNQIRLASELIDGAKNPDHFRQFDNKMVNSKSAIVEFDSQMANDPDLTDMVICMGGDGTLLHVASVFQVDCWRLFFSNLLSIRTFEQDVGRFF